MRGHSSQEALRGVCKASRKATQNQRLPIPDGEWPGVFATQLSEVLKGAAMGCGIPASRVAMQSLTASWRQFGVCSSWSTGPGHYAVGKVDFKRLQGVCVSTRGYDAKRAARPCHKHTQIRDASTGHRRTGGKCGANLCPMFACNLRPMCLRASKA